MPGADEVANVGVDWQAAKNPINTIINPVRTDCLL